MDDEFILDAPVVRDFIGHVRTTLHTGSIEDGLQALRPAFAELLANQKWLPASFREPVAAGGMGGGIATWLLYRAGDGALSLFSLVVPPGAATPVHDHLAWGLVGLYAGEQDEEVFEHDDQTAGKAPLQVASRNRIRPGDFYVLMPPKDDIHRVRTTSESASVSIHLLGNDTGCTWRHTYTPENGEVQAFRSGWSNVPCRDPGAPPDSDVSK
jgi:predicted metal-dependent enzyme (double-stranded beta helix superfamily)